MKRLFVTLAAALLAAACSPQKEEASSQVEAEPQAAENASKLNESLQGIAGSIKGSAKKIETDLESKVDAQKAALLEEISVAAKSLISQYSSSNGELAKQIEGLASQYESIKPSLPADIAKQVEEKLPVLKQHLVNLQAIVAEFSPKSMEHIDAFKSKYDAELRKASELTATLLGILKSGNLELPQMP